MNSVNHPDAEQLNAYVQDPMGDDYRQLRLHLAACMDCREQVGLLTGLKAHLPGIESELYQQSVSQSDELHEVLQSQLIEKYVDGQLDGSEQQRVAGVLQDNGQAMKAALHYASHSACMQREMDDDAGAISIEQIDDPVRLNRTARPGILTTLRRWLEVRSPVWLTVPVTAAVAGILSVVLIPQLELATAKIRVVTYQDNPVIRFKRTQDLPGMGFFADANNVVKPYGRITTRVSDGRVIHLSWPGVDNAISYTMQLQLYTRGQQVSIGKLITTTTQASFKRAVDDNGQRYVWRLTGKTGGGELFSAKGGFVINDGND